MALYVLPTAGSSGSSVGSNLSDAALHGHATGIGWLDNIRNWWNNISNNVNNYDYEHNAVWRENGESPLVTLPAGQDDDYVDTTIHPPGDTAQGDSPSSDPYGYDQAQWEFERQQELLAEQRAFNSAEAEKNRQWQERMSNTAYQRAVEDLEKAGLNKWLAVTGGNGASASTPSGSSATSSAGDASAPNPKIYEALLRFLQAITTSAIGLVDFF